MKQIITISREYGSGGHDIGKLLAERLGIPFYDREIIALAAEQSGEDEDSFEQMNREMDAFHMSLAMLDTANHNDRLFLLQSRTIRKLAEQGSCVIVGRCADYVLRDFADVVNVFISSASLKRVETVAKRSTLFSRKRPEDARHEQMRAVMEMDHRRSIYYNHYTGREWGKASNYHLCIDSSKIGAGAVKVMQTYLETASAQMP